MTTGATPAAPIPTDATPAREPRGTPPAALDQASQTGGAPAAADHRAPPAPAPAPDAPLVARGEQGPGTQPESRMLPAAAPAAASPGSRRANPAPGIPGQGRPEPEDRHAAPQGATATPAAQLSIGRIEVTVITPPQPVARPAAAPNDAFLSKHYLRRL